MKTRSCTKNCKSGLCCCLLSISILSGCYWLSWFAVHNCQKCRTKSQCSSKINHHCRPYMVGQFGLGWYLWVGWGIQDLPVLIKAWSHGSMKPFVVPNICSNKAQYLHIYKLCAKYSETLQEWQTAPSSQMGSFWSEGVLSFFYGAPAFEGQLFPPEISFLYLVHS